MFPETFNLWVTTERILCRHQQQFSINVWAGIVGDCVAGSHVSPHRLTGNRYRGFLLHDLPELLEAVPLAAEHECGACRAVRDVLSKTCQNRGTGTGGPTAWPPRSTSGLNPLNFYLWGHLNPAPVDHEEAHRFVMPVTLFATAPASLYGCGGPWWDVSRRVLNLKEDILSTCYDCILSAVIRKLRVNASGHMLIWKLFLVLVCGTHAQNLSASFSYTLHIYSKSSIIRSNLERSFGLSDNPD
jgi:hypothetical protein